MTRLARRGLMLGGGAAALALATCAAPKEVPPVSDGNLIDAEGTAIHYVALGEGPPVVLIHGASGNLRDWTFSAAPKLAATHRVFVPDRPGLGLSARPEGGQSVFVQARTLRIAAERVGIVRPIVVGHSFGGSVALAWALEAPVAGLVLLGAPSQVWPGGVGAIYDVLGTPGIGRVTSNLVSGLAGDGLIRSAVRGIFSPDPVPEGYVDHLDADVSLTPRAIRNNADDLTALKDTIRTMVPRYPAIEAPTELLHGLADTTVPAAIHSDKTAQEIPDARYTRLDGKGHMIHHSAEAEMLAAIRRLG